MIGERATAGLATATGLLVVATFVAGKAARDATLLSSVAVTSLPLFVGISAVLTFPLVLLTARATGRIGPARLMPLLNAASAMLLVAEWIAMARWPWLTAVAVYLHLAALGPVLVSGFWSTVSERLEPRAAKRRIGGIGLGATLGGIAGGVIAERTAALSSPGAILLVLAGLQLACAVALYVLGRGIRHVRLDAEATPWAAIRVVARSALLREVAGLVVLAAMGAAALDYVFKADLMRGTTAMPLRPLAIYYTVTSILTALVQLAITGKLVRRLGAPRSVVVLPATLIGFTALAVVMPAPFISMLARGSEVIARSSIYRAAYELLFAPLPAADKRPAKVLVDVGADRLGDLLGAQLVAGLLYAIPSPRSAILIMAAVLGVLALVLALDLRRTYTRTLEQRLLDGAPLVVDRPWSTLPAAFGETGDLTALSLLDMRAADPTIGLAAHLAGTAVLTHHPLASLADQPAVDPTGHLVPYLAGSAVGVPAPRPLATLVDPTAPRPVASAASDEPRPGPPTIDIRDPAVADLADLRSGRVERVKLVLARPLAPDLASHVVPLLGWEPVTNAARNALQAIAPQITGQLVDALLDRDREFSVRRRLPAILASGEPALASWGLWRAVRDPRFEVRYRSGKALAMFRDAGAPLDIAPDAVFDAVQREVSVDGRIWQSHRLLDGHDGSDLDVLLHRVLEQRSATGLDHVFTLLGLALPAEPLRISLQAVSTSDQVLRGTALEYLESVLPERVREPLWPFLEVDRAPRVPARTHGEIVAALKLSHPSIISHLRARHG